jgi:hypothetical protein
MPGFVSTDWMAPELPQAIDAIGLQSRPVSGGLTADILNHCPAPFATYMAVSPLPCTFQLR